MQKDSIARDFVYSISKASLWHFTHGRQMSLKSDLCLYVFALFFLIIASEFEAKIWSAQEDVKDTFSPSQKHGTVQLRGKRWYQHVKPKKLYFAFGQLLPICVNLQSSLRMITFEIYYICNFNWQRNLTDQIRFALSYSDGVRRIECSEWRVFGMHM